MKKIFKLLMLAIVSSFALASCEDVPEPYPNPNGGDNTGGTTEDTKVEPAGSGTLADPYNVAAIVEKINAMESGAESTEAYYIKGKVKSNSTTEETITKYGNMSFDMIDEGNSSVVFKAFQVYGPGNQKFTSVDQIKEGDEVVVYGKVVNYQGNTPETVGKGAAYVYSINGGGSTDTPDTPVEAKAVTCAEAAELCNALADNATSDETYSITGYITSIVGTVSRNQQSFWMADTKDGGKVFNAFYANLPEGVSEFTVGSKVKITGQLMKYVKASDSSVTPEMKNATVEILETGDNTGGNTDQPSTGDVEEITAAEALALIAALADAGQTDKQYIVTGKVESITEISTSYGNATFVLEGGLTIFRCKDIGNVNFTDANRLKVGDEVKVQGYLKKYVKDDVTTPEVTSGQLISINGSTEGSSTGGDNPGDNTGGNTGGETTNDGSKVITFVVGTDKGTCTSSAAGADKMSKNGVTISVTKGALANTDNYRTYKNETMTIASSASNIASIEFTCTAEGDAQYGPGCFTTETGSYTYSGKVGTWTGDAASVSLKATTNQVRATKIVVTLK